MADKDAMQRREVYFCGRVQGVGFRYTVRGIASRFDVTGFVKNLPDGRVELVVEGMSGHVGSFLAAVETDLGRYITQKQQATCPPIGQFPEFEIRF